MEILTAILCISAFVVILLIVKMALRRNIKDFTIKVSFFKGFELSCSFFEKAPKQKMHKLSMRQ